MRLDATKSKEKGLFVSSDPTPCFTFFIHIKILDCEFFNDTLLNTGTSACFMDRDFAIKYSLGLIERHILHLWKLLIVGLLFREM
jgi:hypothetical protein